MVLLQRGRPSQPRDAVCLSACSADYSHDFRLACPARPIALSNRAISCGMQKARLEAHPDRHGESAGGMARDDTSVRPWPQRLCGCGRSCREQRLRHQLRSNSGASGSSLGCKMRPSAVIQPNLSSLPYLARSAAIASAVVPASVTASVAPSFRSCGNVRPPACVGAVEFYHVQTRRRHREADASRAFSATQQGYGSGRLDRCPGPIKAIGGLGDVGPTPRSKWLPGTDSNHRPSG